MFARKREYFAMGRLTAIAATTALVLSGVIPSFAHAGASRGDGIGTAVSGATDISARRRLAPGAAAAAFAGIVGTGVAIAAAQNRRAYYEDYYGYGGPVYAVPGPGPGPYYYGYDPAYGPNHYGADVPYVNGHPLAGW